MQSILLYFIEPWAKCDIILHRANLHIWNSYEVLYIWKSYVVSLPVYMTFIYKQSCPLYFIYCLFLYYMYDKFYVFIIPTYMLMFKYILLLSFGFLNCFKFNYYDSSVHCDLERISIKWTKKYEYLSC